MTDKLTLREKAIDFAVDLGNHDISGDMAAEIVNYIAALLEDTGSPAHMRVAAELRGE